jgi:hypothetical protein
MRRPLVASLVCGMAAAGTAPARAQEMDVDAIPVKPAIAARLTPEQLHARRLAIAQAIKEGRLQRNLRPQANPRSPADTCTAATYEITGLPFNPPPDTTVGMIDDYDLPGDIAVPTCTASTNCTVPGALAGCGLRGCIFAGTGTAPDRAYRIRVSAPCDLTITGTPAPPDWDLALVVYQTQCSSSLADCVCVDDMGIEGQAESVLVNAVTGLDYFIVIDGYLDLTPPPPPPPPNLGPFNLSVTGAGCNLVPVQLLDFKIS